MSEKRRASAGNTHDPWPCCGSEAGTYGRRKNAICKACAALIEEGKAARAAATAAKDAGGLDVFGWSSADYGWPRFYGNDAQFPHRFEVDGERVDVHDQLGDAFWHLVNTISQPAPADTPRHSPKYEMRKWSGSDKAERHHLPWPWVLSSPKRQGYSPSWQFEILVLMNPAARDAVDKLFTAINLALSAVYQEGKERGGSALMQLARGELSLADFDDALKPAEKRRR
jgi:hypothetical protein